MDSIRYDPLQEFKPIEEFMDFQLEEGHDELPELSCQVVLNIQILPDAANNGIENISNDQEEEISNQAEEEVWS